MHDAIPATSACVAQPATVDAPSRNATVPVGIPLAGATADTVAVYEMTWPTTEGFADEAIIAAVAPWLVVCVNADDVEPVKLESPLYTAVMACTAGCVE